MTTSQQERELTDAHSSDNMNDDLSPRSFNRPATDDDSRSVSTSATASEQMCAELVAGLVALRTNELWVERFNQHKNHSKWKDIWTKLLDMLRTERADANKYTDAQFIKKWNNIVADYKRLNDAAMVTGADAKTLRN